MYRFLATGEDTDGKYSLWDAIVTPGGGLPPHVHSREEEGFYVLEGEITFTIGGKRLVAGALAAMIVGYLVIAILSVGNLSPDRPRLPWG